MKKLEMRVRRHPMKRMCQIHQILARQGGPGTREIAEELEVSERTVRRDIEYMRDHFGMPIRYNFRKRGYEYTQSVPGFPPTAMMEVLVGEGEEEQEEAA